jgi:FlaG/FlaF family flagellin (archaellin)
MVAITVILAAVIGSFVLGIGGDLDETPQVRLGVSDATDANGTVNSTNPLDSLFVIEHQGGSSLSGEELSLIATNTSSGDKISKIDSISGLSIGDRQTISETDENEVTTSTDIRVRVVHKPTDSLLLDTIITVE